MTRRLYPLALCALFAATLLVPSTTAQTGFHSTTEVTVEFTEEPIPTGGEEIRRAYAVDIRMPLIVGMAGTMDIRLAAVVPAGSGWSMDVEPAVHTLLVDQPTTTSDTYTFMGEVILRADETVRAAEAAILELVATADGHPIVIGSKGKALFPAAAGWDPRVSITHLGDPGPIPAGTIVTWDGASVTNDGNAPARIRTAPFRAPDGCLVTAVNTNDAVIAIGQTMNLQLSVRCREGAARGVAIGAFTPVFGYDTSQEGTTTSLEWVIGPDPDIQVASATPPMNTVPAIGAPALILALAAVLRRRSP